MPREQSVGRGDFGVDPHPALRALGGNVGRGVGSDGVSRYSELERFTDDKASMPSDIKSSLLPANLVMIAVRTLESESCR
jgi:hypothetical protein